MIEILLYSSLTCTQAQRLMNRVNLLDYMTNQEKTEIIIELKRNVLYDQKSLQKIIGSVLLEKLSIQSLFDWKESIKLLLSGLKAMP